MVDELHTYDGAQGTDLACLLRRLKARLKTPAVHLCCVGTSATLGGPEHASRLQDYASQVFGEPFDGEALITESVLEPEAFFGDAPIDTTLEIPGTQHVADLDAENFADVQTYLQRQAALWLGMERPDMGSDAWRLAMGTRLLSHVFFRNLIVLLTRQLSTLEELAGELEKRSAIFAEGDRRYHSALLGSLLALISSALAPSPDGGNPRPFLQVRLQLWMRELRRMVCSIGQEPSLRFSDDLTPEQSRKHLPLLHCRECGETGWLGTMRQQDAHINPDLQHIYDGFFSYQPTTHFLFPGGQPPADPALQFGQTLCGQCLHLVTGTEASSCSACGNAHALVPVWVHNPRHATRTNRMVSSHNCPYCGGQDSLTIMGSRAASLISVSIAQLFTSIYNDDRKLLAFSDSVQDAAHRAGFFGARTYRFNFRMALQQCVARLDAPLSFAELPQVFQDYYRHVWDTDHYITTLLPPDMSWLDDYEFLVTHGRLPDESDLPDLVFHRIRWEIASEYAFRSRIGRTLEKSGCSVAGVDLVKLEQAIDSVLEPVRNAVGGLEGVSRERLVAFTNGFLTLLKTKGAVFLPPLQAYVAQFGGSYMLHHGFNQRFMPRFGRRTRTPVFLTTRPGTRFDPIEARGTAQTWYQDWATRSLGDLCPHIADFARSLYDPILTALVQTGILDEQQIQGDGIWGFRPEALLVHTAVVQCRCDTCGHNVSIQAAEAPLWTDGLCLRLRCTGRYQMEPVTQDYYGRLYATGHIQRIIPAEHTALLERQTREQVERQFIEDGHPWDPNLLSCTPTLEMGIDIGDLSVAILCSIPPSQSSYLQRIGRTGRRDGNSFNLAVANGRPHDLYFYAQPQEMLTGAIEPPGCFLNASAVLERQFVAFCFDNWVQTGIDVTAIPRRVGTVLSHLTAKNQERLFPFTLLTYIELHRSTLFARFVGLFDGLPEPVVAKLRGFVEGDERGRPGVLVTILQGLEGIANELKSLRARVRALRQMIKRLQNNPAKDADFQEDLDQLEIERGAMASIARSIIEKNTYNFFTDEGLLPNYAFPEAGMLLRSVILRRKAKEDGKGRYKATVFEYERPAVSAIHELAPSNRFYAEGRRVTIDQIDMRLAEIEAWRFCNACPHMELVTSDGPQSRQCPRCGSVLWADEGQVRRLIKMRQVIATTTDRDSRIQDDSDDRDPAFFNKHMLVAVEAQEIVSAYRIDAPEMPFGFEYIQKADFREINFGNRNALGDTITLAGHTVPTTGFAVCRRCGKVENTQNAHQPDAFKHAVGCSARKSQAAAPLLECIYLYREFSSEALRILLPVTSFAGSDERLQSFIAAILVGLRRTFHGNIDHLEATVQEEPIPETPLQKKYLVLYDRVPGGTGYLKELCQSAQAMMNLFDAALTVLQRCACSEDPEKDGCYRCVYAYRNSFDIPSISRRLAIHSLSDLLQYRDRLVRTDTITTISQHTLLESELEAYFIEALHRERYNERPVQLRKDIVHHKTGWYCKVNENGYYIEPQVELSANDGVPIATRPDFVMYPERQQVCQPIAVYLDGFTHHADTSDGASRVGDDMAKRMGLVRSGRFHVWSLTWHDVESRFHGGQGHFAPLLRAVSATQRKLIQSFDKDTKVGCLGDVNQLDSFSLLVRFLAEPHHRAWQASAAIQMFVQLDMNGCDGDDIQLELERLLGDESEWVAALRPTAEDEGLLKGTLADTATEGQGHLELITWSTKAAIQQRRLDAVRVVCRLDDLGDVRNATDFKKAWNGFLRLYNLMQFLPECVFVTAQGLHDSVYQSLEFVCAPEAGAPPLEEVQPLDADYMDVVDAAVLDALRDLALHGVRLPGVDAVPFELCGPHGNIIGQAELAWDDPQIAFLYEDEDDTASRQAFTQAGWSTWTIEELVARPSDFVEQLKGGER